MLGLCVRCDDAVATPSPEPSVCFRCRDATRNAIHAREDPSAHRQHVFPIVERHTVSELTVGVLEVETWTTLIVLRYALFPASRALPVRPDFYERIHLGLWRVVDDIGQQHLGIGGGAEQQDSVFGGDVWLTPPLDVNASLLAITFRGYVPRTTETIDIRLRPGP
jgi:hypothetical protein